MESERRYLLQLVSLGRMSAGEAERWAMVWNEARETRWILIACFVLALAGEIRGSAWAEHGWLAAGFQAGLHHALSLIQEVMGRRP